MSCRWRPRNYAAETGIIGASKRGPGKGSVWGACLWPQNFRGRGREIPSMRPVDITYWVPPWVTKQDPISKRGGGKRQRNWRRRKRRRNGGGPESQRLQDQGTLVSQVLKSLDLCLYGNCTFGETGPEMGTGLPKTNQGSKSGPSEFNSCISEVFNTHSHVLDMYWTKARWPFLPQWQLGVGWGWLQLPFIGDTAREMSGV